MDRAIKTLKKIPGTETILSLPWVRSLYHLVWAFAGHAWYRFPGRRITVIGVTGTKGKTSVLELVNAIFEAAGKRTALISSIRVKVNDQGAKNMTGNSMPGRAYLPKFLDRAVRTGCAYALVETTSEGVRLHRHRFIRWRYALITNLSPEHIESHGTFERYRDAKADFLVYAAKTGATVCIGKESEHADYFLDRVEKEVSGVNVLLYAKSDLPIATLLSSIPASPPDFLSFDFNRANAAAAIYVARDCGIDDEAIRRALQNFKGVPGRMEFVQTEPFRVVVDYAHTPDSLEAVYRALKSSAGTGRLIGVLGSCGGGRDRWKRPAMGRIAAEYLDEIILANEDPYDEPPEAILEAIASGFKDASNETFKNLDTHYVIPDRTQAIEKAILLARTGDTVVMTGKGSESWIHMERGKKIPWNEHEAAQAALKKQL